MAQRRPRERLLAAGDRVRPLRAVPLRADDHDLRADLPGPEGRADLSDARRVAALVRELWSGPGRGRHRRGVSPLARAGRGRDGAHRAARRCSPGWPFARASAGPSLAVLRRGRQPDHAVDHRLARASACSSGCSTTRSRGRSRRSGSPGWRRLHGTAGLFTSALGAHLTWTLPFGLLIMFAVFNRFNPRLRGGRARPRRHAVADLPPRRAAADRPVAGRHRLFGFTLSWDEIARSTRRSATPEHAAARTAGLTTTVTTPAIYALGTLTTGVSFAVIGISLLLIRALRRRQPASAGGPEV